MEHIEQVENVQSAQPDLPHLLGFTKPLVPFHFGPSVGQCDAVTALRVTSFKTVWFITRI